MNSYEKNSYLMHHGVKGMKWGVRKQIAKSSNKVAKDVSDIYEYSREQKRRKNRKTYRHESDKMSDDELRRYINRRNLEQQYDDIRNRQETKQGDNYLGNFLHYAVPITSIAAEAVSVAALIYMAKKGK